MAIVFVEIGDRLVIGNETARQPHRLQIAASLAFQAPGRRHTVEVAVDIELQQNRWMIRWPTRRLWVDAAEADSGEIKLINKDIDRPNRIVLADPIVQAFGKQRALPAIHPLYKALHPIPRSNHQGIIPGAAFSHSQGQKQTCRQCVGVGWDNACHVILQG